ncbi:MAG: flagellar basal-body MS-ring/collar protein FliF, partial [Myxococcota bacterium]
MGSWLEELSAQLRALPAGRQAMLGLAALGSLAFFAWITAGATGDEYRALYRGLAEDEAAQVADALAAEKIAYRVSDGGTAILVPAADVAQARMRMAGRSLPSGGGAGFELFDRPAFGVTDFVHRVNYMRAVQGELARSIEQLDAVDRARVQVVVPERGSVLAARERRARASAVLRLVAGRALGEGQVRAVVHLIASSIEDLDPAEVTVVDASGRLLAPLEDGPPGSLASGGAAGYQQRVEEELARGIEEIIEKTTGPGGVIARVRADLDWTETETTQEIFDPDSQVARSEQRSTELSQDGGDVGGVPGLAANSPDASAPLASDGSGGSSRNTETINYEISRTTSRHVVPRGQIQRLSIAVLVADRAEGAEGAEPVAWDADSLTLFEELARQATGFDEKRGDQITVRSAPFRLPETEPMLEPSFWPEWAPLLRLLAKAAFGLLALVMFGR